MTTFPDVARIARDRAEGFLDEAGCREALAAAGFVEPESSARALDHLLGRSRGPDAGEILAGCAASADPGRAFNNAVRLLASDVPIEQLPVALGDLCTFLGASQHMADLLVARPELVRALGRPFDAAGAGQRYRAAGSDPAPEAALRQAQAEDLLSIAWHDLVDGLDVEQVTILLSRLADAAVCGAARGLGIEGQFAIVALGKLGGLELNYSSDIDLIFVRPDHVADQITADTLAHSLIRLLGHQTVDGHLYRVDMRLRPEGAAGVLTRTVSSCMEYYRRMGRPWERQMLTKARLVLDAEGAGEAFLQQTRQWVLGHGLDAPAIRQFKRLKAATEARVDDETRPDVKHAPGGIRDIETIVQFLSLVHAAHNPWLVCNATLHGLERLRVAGALTSIEAARLRRAYLFHRQIENLLQLMHRVQTHRLPVDLTPLARLMGARDGDSFLSELGEHRRRVRRIFEEHFAHAFPDTESPAARVSALLLEPDPDQAVFEEALAECGFRNPSSSLAVLRRAAAPVSRFLPTSPRLLSALASALPALFDRLALTADGDAAFDRFERMTRGMGAREILYEQLRSDDELLTILVDLAYGSPHLADLLANEPMLIDEFMDALFTGERGRRERRGLLSEISQRGDPWVTLSDYKKLETLRIGVLDLHDRLPVSEVLTELSQLCIDVLRAAFRLVYGEAQAEMGTPMRIHGVSARLRTGMVVLALGKVGGLEANYASDADIIFIHGGDGETDQGVSNTVFFSHVAQEFMARLGGRRGNPRLYEADARLRPEGAKGPLVTSLRAFKKYYASPRAALFEFQALLKARIVAGDAELGQEVQATIRTILRRYPVPDDLADQLREMRSKIEATAQRHDLKRGTGGMVDIEQLTQFMQLRAAARQPAVLVQETPRALEMLGDHGLISPERARWLRDTYLFFRRVETRLQIALGLDTKALPEDPKALRDLAVRLGYADTAEGDAGHLLLIELEEATEATRRRYDEIMA